MNKLEKKTEMEEQCELLGKSGTRELILISENKELKAALHSAEERKAKDIRALLTKLSLAKDALEEITIKSKGTLPTLCLIQKIAKEALAALKGKP